MNKEQLISVYEWNIKATQEEYDKIAMKYGGPADLELALLQYPVPMIADLQNAHCYRLWIGMYKQFIKEIKELK